MIKYYSEVGSFRGCVKYKNRWVSVKNLNYISKLGWFRVSGPPTFAMCAAMKELPIDLAKINPFK